VALLGMLGMYMLACAADVIVAPFGIDILMVLVGVEKVCSCGGTEFCWKKCPVLPMSAIVETTIDEGGPTEDVINELACKCARVLNVRITFVSIFLFGSPPPHAFVVVVDAGRGGRTNTWTSLRLRCIIALPPIIA
jgi:hypothetical protein